MEENHSVRWLYTGYPVWRGQILNGDELWNLIEGLEANDLLYYTHLLTGGYDCFIIY